MTEKEKDNKAITAKSELSRHPMLEASSKGLPCCGVSLETSQLQNTSITNVLHSQQRLNNYHTQLSASQLDSRNLSINHYTLFLRSHLGLLRKISFLSPWFLQFSFTDKQYLISNIKIAIIAKTSSMPALSTCDFLYPIYWNSILLVRRHFIFLLKYVSLMPHQGDIIIIMFYIF